MSFLDALLYQPFINILVFFYKIFGQNLGWAIIGLTIFLRIALIPLSSSNLKMNQKMKEFQPELEKLKKKYKDDKQAFAQAQIKLYQKHGINPAGGCLPLIIQLVILGFLYKAFRQVLQADDNVIDQLNNILYPFLRLPKEMTFNTHFFYLDLAKPDLIDLPFKLNLGLLRLEKIPGLFLIAAALTQFWSSKLMLPKVEQAEKVTKRTPEREDDVAVAMQKQMVYMMPIMTLFIGFSSGLVLYWLAFSLFMLIQQLYFRKRGARS